MKKVVRTSLNNVANKRGVRDLNIQLYSHDKNNAGFEFVIKNEVDLSEYKAKVLFDFQESFATWETKGTIEGNVVKVKFDTTFITKCEEVIGYLFLDSETDTLDVFKFKFNVVLSEIDKYDTTKRGFRYIKDQEVVDVITRSELEEELKKIQINGGIDLSNYLTTSVANDTFATKQELGSYATKDELPSISGLVTTEQLTTAKNSVVEEINNKGYVTSTVAEETYVKKSDLPTPYNDSALVQKIGQLEARVDNDTVYDDAPLKERVTALESKAIAGGAYDDTHLRERLDTLEAKQDKDTVYDDAPLKQRVEVLETKVDKDTVYNDEEVKQRLTVLENKPAVDTSHFITDETLNSKNYLTATVAEETYAKKSEIPQAYNDSALVERVTTLENRPTTGGSVDTTNLVTKDELKEKEDDIYDAIHQNPLYKVYTEDTLTEHLNNENVLSIGNLDSRAGIIYSNGSRTTADIFKGDLGKEKFVDFHTAMFTLANSIPDNYNLTELLYSGEEGKKVTFLSNKNFSQVVPKEELKAIIKEFGGTGSNIDTSNLATKEELAKAVTKEELEEKHYLTEIFLNNSELAQKVNLMWENDSKIVTKEELEEKHYVTNEQISSTYATKSEIPQPYSDTELVKRITVLENKQDNDTVYDDTPLKERAAALESRVRELEYKLRDYDSIYSAFVPKGDLNDYVKRTELPAPYDDTELRNSLYSIIDSTIENELRNKEYEFNSRFVAKDNLRSLVTEIVSQLKSENN